METGGFLQQVSETTSSTFKPVVDAVDPLCGRMDNVLDGVYAPLATKATELHDALDSDHDGSVSVIDLYNVGNTAVTSVTHGVNDAVTTVTGSVNGAVSSVTGTVNGAVSKVTGGVFNVYSGVVVRSAQSVDYWLPEEKEGKKAEKEAHSLVDVSKTVGKRVLTRVEAYSAGPLKQRVSIDVVLETKNFVAPMMEKGVTYSTQILQSFGSQKTSIVESGKTGLNHVSQAIVNVQKPIIQKVPFKITPELYISEVRHACSDLGEEVVSVLNTTQAVRAPLEACALMLILLGLRNDRAGKYDDLLEHLTMTTKTLLDWSKIYAHKNDIQMRSNGVSVQ